MTPTVFEITLGQNSADHRVICNGVDITDAVGSVNVLAESGEPTSVHIGLVASAAVVKVRGALEVIGVSVPADPACPTCGSHQEREL